MRDFFARVREQFGAGLTKATTKSRVALETVRLRRQIDKIAKEKAEALAQLGAQAYTEICQRGHVEQGGLTDTVNRIQETDRAIEALQQEIARLEALEAATPWFAGGEPPIASCTCGAPLPTGTKFCENCGANVQELVAKAEAEQRARVEAAQQARAAALCPQCGARISSTRAKFCRHCGAAFPGTSEAGRPE